MRIFAENWRVLPDGKIEMWQSSKLVGLVVLETNDGHDGHEHQLWDRHRISSKKSAFYKYIVGVKKVRSESFGWVGDTIDGSIVLSYTSRFQNNRYPIQDKEEITRLLGSGKLT